MLCEIWTKNELGQNQQIATESIELLLVITWGNFTPNLCSYTPQHTPVVCSMQTCNHSI